MVFLTVSTGGKNLQYRMGYSAGRDNRGEAFAERGDGSWLSEIRGKCAIGEFLLAATDKGIVRLETDLGKIVKTKEFPDTEPFVNAESHLFPGKDGLYAVDEKEIKLLKMI